MRKTSLQIMENTLDLLNKIQLTKAPDHLYDKVLERIEAAPARSVPMYWIKAAAVAIFLLLVTDIAVIKMHKMDDNQSVTSQLIEIDNYQLYHD